MRAAIGKLKHISPAAGNRLSQSRAVRRMGELYKTFNAQGQRTDQLKEGTLQKLTQKEVAESAGLSEHQLKQAVRVANVPADKFEAAIEQSKPATVTAPRRSGNYFRLRRLLRKLFPNDLNGLYWIFDRRPESVLIG